VEIPSFESGIGLGAIDSHKVRENPKSDPKPVLGLDQFGGKSNGKTKDIFSRTDPHEIAGSRGVTSKGQEYEGSLPSTGDQRTDLLSLEEGIWGLDTTQAKKLKELEKENSRLKGLVADLSLDNAILP